uniref:Uncharacterized protein n=1 Tax=Myoviridae sp. ctqfO1 TaxID=2827710 RepID=A0A8S5T3A7_9CAUD|nr:MAG TPA: hypothetical protein [Myoviridae sp. ctqfO1]
MFIIFSPFLLGDLLTVYIILHYWLCVNRFLKKNREVFMLPYRLCYLMP